MLTCCQSIRVAPLSSDVWHGPRSITHDPVKTYFLLNDAERWNRPQRWSVDDSKHIWHYIDDINHQYVVPWENEQTYLLTNRCRCHLTAAGALPRINCGRHVKVTEQLLRVWIMTIHICFQVTTTTRLQKQTLLEVCFITMLNRKVTLAGKFI